MDASRQEASAATDTEDVGIHDAVSLKCLGDFEMPWLVQRVRKL